MKCRKPLVVSLFSIGLIFAGAAVAQDQQSQPMPPPPPPNPAQVPMPPPPPSMPAADGSATVSGSQGPVVVNSSMGPAPSNPPPPPFSTLAGRKGFITSADAASYPPLANDFGYADRNHDGHVTRAEYKRWVNQAQ